jgi:predicted RNA polymerase sigma factor
MAEGPSAAISAYQMALQLDPAHAERAFIQKRISQLTAEGEAH